ncbi:MAG: AarF/ABC1/UbiB kinase family protein [Gammaproteobacteria bacterium]
MAQQSTLPHSRFGRFAKLGGLASSLAGSVIYEGGKNLLSGNKPVISDLVMSPKNASRISEKLSEMRGAAMKVGQLLSMDVGYLLPKEVSEIFSSLRNDAHQMPMLQVADILVDGLGKNWKNEFKRFAFNPIASASIGQVHSAELKNGKQVAIKLQYPGVRESIDSDINNIAMMLNLFRMIPEDVDIAPLIEDARQQLHAEADYVSEAAFLNEFREYVAEDERFELPEVIEALSSDKILTTTFMEGIVIFANYLFSETTGKIQLLDFGATRRYPSSSCNNFMQLLKACIESDKETVLNYAIAIGYTSVDDESSYQSAIVDLIMTATMPIRHDGAFDFRHSQLSQLMMEKLMKLRFEQRYTRLPPTDILFLHRKLGGLYLLLSHLGARVNVKQLVHDTLLQS